VAGIGNEDFKVSEMGNLAGVGFGGGWVSNMGMRANWDLFGWRGNWEWVLLGIVVGVAIFRNCVILNLWKGVFAF
jgi:hypothetical protein